MKKNILSFFRFILVPVFSLVFFLPKGFCESNSGLGSSTELDSLSEENWNEETLYKISALRLQRWVKQNPAVMEDPFVAKQLPELLNEAKTASQNNDFYMANLWLDSIWELLKPSESETGETNLNASLFDESFGYGLGSNKSKFKWSNELISGVDLWRQEFSLKILEEDSTFLESNGNPFSGVRFSMDYTSANGSQLNGHTFFKYSKDYLSGEAYFDYSWRVSPSAKWRFKNRFEGTSFYGDFDLKYLQNLSSLDFIFNVKPFSFEVGDDFQIRNYVESDSIYSSYINNSFDLTSRLNWGFSSQLSLRYRNVQRQHRENDINDYKENGFLLGLSQGFGSRLSLNLDNELRFRNYLNVPADYFLQDYWENYFTGDIQWNFTNWFGLKLDGSLTKRQYDFVNENSLPDVLNWDVEPEMMFTLNQNWKIGAGFHYGIETHEKLLAQFDQSSDAVTDAVSSVYSIEFEDFYEYGPVVTLEVFKINSLILTVREAFLFRRYPNSSLTNSTTIRLNTDLASINSSSYSLYSDRSNNSLLIFLTWTLSPQWRLTVLANFDDDRSLEDESGDSQNTLFDFEVSFSF